MRIALASLVPETPKERKVGSFGVRTLAGYLRSRLPAELKKETEIRCFNLNDHLRGQQTSYHNALRAFSNELAAFAPHITGLSLFWDTLRAVTTLKAALAHLDTLVVAGNSLATFGGKELLARPELRGMIAVEGEGEEALTGIVTRAAGTAGRINDPALYAGIPNVRTSPNGEIVRKVVDLNKYPDINESDGREIFGVDLGGYQPLETSRGCSWHACSFCSVAELTRDNSHTLLPVLYPARPPRWRPFPLEVVTGRIERFLKMGLHGFYPVELTFLSGTTGAEFNTTYDRAARFAEELIRLQKKYSKEIKVVRAAIKTENVYKAGEDENNIRRIELLKLLRRAGFRQFNLGLESGDNDRLMSYGKGVTREENLEAVRTLRSLGFSIDAGLIFFNPDGTLAEIGNDLSFIAESGLTRTRSGLFHDLRAQAGSRIVKKLQARGLVGEQLDLNSVSYPVLRYEDPGVDRLHRLFKGWEAVTGHLIDYICKSDCGYAAAGPAGLPLPHEARGWDYSFNRACYDQHESDLQPVVLAQAGDMKKRLARLETQLAAGEINDPQKRLPAALAETRRRLTAYLLELGEVRRL